MASGAGISGVVEQTPDRGQPDAPHFQTPMSAPRAWQTGSRAFAIALWVALLLHVPLVPTRLFAWMRLALATSEVELTDLDGEVIVPIDFDLEPAAPAAAPPPPAAPEPPPAAAPVAAEAPAPSP